MYDCNVVVSLREHCYKHARAHLGRYGQVQRTEFYNVLALKVADVPEFLTALNHDVECDPRWAACVARVAPVTRTFLFQSAEEFETNARAAVSGWVPELRNRQFHVRMHRRGFKGRLSSQIEERFLDEFLLGALRDAGAPGHIGFDDPDAVILVETLGQWAGLSFWRREELARYPLIRAD